MNIKEEKCLGTVISVPTLGTVSVIGYIMEHVPSLAILTSLGNFDIIGYFYHHWVYAWIQKILSG